MSLLHVTTSFSGVSAAQGSIVLSLDVLLESVSFSKRENFLANFVVLWLFMKVFSMKFGSVVFFGTAKTSNPEKFSSQKSYFSPTHECFLPRKFHAIRYPQCS